MKKNNIEQCNIYVQLPNKVPQGIQQCINIMNRVRQSMISNSLINVILITQCHYYLAKIVTSHVFRNMYALCCKTTFVDLRSTTFNEVVIHSVLLHRDIMTTIWKHLYLDLHLLNIVFQFSFYQSIRFIQNKW